MFPSPSSKISGYDVYMLKVHVNTEWASHFITFNSEIKLDFGQKRSSTQLCIYMWHITTGSSVVFTCNFEPNFLAVPQSCQQISPRKHKLDWLKVFFQKDQHTWADVSPGVVKLRLHTADTASSQKFGSVAQKQQWATQHRGQLQCYVYSVWAVTPLTDLTRVCQKLSFSVI